MQYIITAYHFQIDYLYIVDVTQLSVDIQSLITGSESPLFGSMV